MESDLLVIKKRGNERILALGVAGISIVLGFLLFLVAPELPANSAAEYEGVKMKFILSNIAPGVFFALFGAVITVYSIITQAKINGNVMMEADNKTFTTQNIQFLQKESKHPDENKNLRGIYQQDFRTYSRIIQKIDSDEEISNDLKLDFESTLNNTKKTLMRSVWDEKWGEFSDFDNWLKMGCPEPVPDKISEAANFFLGQ